MLEGIIVIALVVWACKKGVESGHLNWQGSKAANRRSTRGRSIPRRAASAVQHDAGYWLHQVLNGFPQARRGFANGWHAGRTAQAQGAAERHNRRTEHLEGRAGVIEQVREQQRRQAEALERIRAAQEPEPEFPVLLTARSRSGRPVNPITGEPEDTISVWDQEDLNRRLAAAADDPDMEVTTRPIPDDDDDPAWNGAGVAAPEDGEAPPAAEGSEGTTEGTSPETSPSTPTTEEGTQMASDVTYDGVIDKMSKDRATAENITAEQAKAAQEANQTADEMQALDLDPATLGAMADHLDAIQAAQKAQERVMETSEAVTSTLQRQQGQLAEAHKDTAHAADKEFFVA